MSFSNYLEGEIVKHAMRTGSWTKPTNLYAALFTDDPAEDASGTEVSGGAYAGNVNSILFPSPSGANWGTVTHTALFDSLTTGNMYFYGVLAVSKVIDDGDPAPFFPADQFGITLD